MHTNKSKFLKSEHGKWEYWKGFSYAEYLRTMAQDATKCDCGVYYWKGFKRMCNCK